MLKRDWGLAVQSIVIGLGMAWLCACCMIATAAAQTLVVEAKIPLGPVQGRIDHLAIDVARQRLYVAELGNDSLGVVDLQGHRVVRTVTGLHEPQGVAYLAATDTVWVANGGDGTLRLFRGEDAAPTATLPLGDDADNIRVDAATNRIYVGYGAGAIAIFDARTHRRVGTIALAGHPEGFQLDSSRTHAYVNVPDADQIAVVDIPAQRPSATWRNENSSRANFPVAIDHGQQRLLVGYRSPPALIVYDARTGKSLRQIPVCGDTDDIAWLPKRQLAYVGCGEGFVEVIDLGGERAQRVARLTTVAGARTLLYAPEFDRLYVAVRSTAQEPAAIWIFRPDP